MPMRFSSLAAMTVACAVLLSSGPLAGDHRSIAADGTLTLVAEGKDAIPIVVLQNAPPFTRKAADDLAEYIARTSGAKPRVMEGQPEPLPASAIWVGYQPALKGLFPKVDFEFRHPEEILIACDGKNLVIAGRDKWDPNGLVVKGRRYEVNGIQEEYGTVNAVYTFLQDHLGVRWLWPGETGIDVAEKKTLAFGSFEYRYHPVMRSRSGIFSFAELLLHSAYGHSQDWARFQRLQLDSLNVHPGHAFKTWWERFHKTHPEYFALQPNGTRGGGDKPYPSAESVKMCESNPGVWEQWIADVKEQIRENPSLTCFNASPNDGYLSGNCVCEKCVAWDHPDAELRPSVWQGAAKQTPALSDRDVTFANQCARLLKERFPGKNYYVSMNAYGNSRPAPLKAVPDDNVIISNVANMFWSLNEPDKDSINGKTYASEYAAWGKLTKNQVWRPNTGNPAGWQNGLPDVPIERVMQSFRWAVDNHCIGIAIDSIWEHWATQGPLYYVLAKMAWNPSQDWRAVMDDYYRRGFGPAEAEVKEYWAFLEASRNRKVDEYPGEANGYEEVYNQAFFDKAYGLLDAAAKKVAGAPEKYQRRVEFVRAGLDHTRLCAELRRLCAQMLRNGLGDKKTVEQVKAKWAEIEKHAGKIPHAIYWPTIRPGQRMMRGGLFDPGQVATLSPKQIAPWLKPGAKAHDAPKVELQAPEQAGWELVFKDAFDRDELGRDWKVAEGSWKVDKGTLHGAGTLLSARPFPESGLGYLRMEFDAVAEMSADGEPAKAKRKGRVSDVSSLLHAKDAAEPLKTGYFFQFGSRWNELNSIMKAGASLAVDGAPTIKITPNRVQRFVVESDKGRVSLFVNGQGVLTGKEGSALLGDGHDRVGFYAFTPVRISNVRVYVKRLSTGLDVE